MNIDNDLKLDYSDVLIRPKRSNLNSRSDVDITRKYVCPHSGTTLNGTGIISSNMTTVTTQETAKVMRNSGCFAAMHKHMSLMDYQRLFSSSTTEELSTFLTFGRSEKDIQKLKALIKIYGKGRFSMICLDVANGYLQNFSDHCKKIRELLPDSFIIAGNVVTPEMTEQLALSGASMIKVGIGNGSGCLTRRMTGVGYPQLSATIECADAAHGLNAHLCADGGCTTAGDVCKAFGAGADFVMLGGMLAGHNQNTSVTEINGKKYGQYYGMSSELAMERHHGGKAQYRASEGRAVYIDYRGDLNHTINEILGGVRSMMTYVGAKKLKEIPKRTSFVRVNNQLNTVFENNKEV